MHRKTALGDHSGWFLGREEIVHMVKVELVEGTGRIENVFCLIWLCHPPPPAVEEWVGALRIALL